MKVWLRKPVVLLLAIAGLFLAVRLATIYVYNVHYRHYYYYGMVAMSFAVADGKYYGHPNAEDRTLVSAAQQLANRTNRFVPLEDWATLPRSGEYRTHAPNDIPGYGYLIAWTSRWFGGRLTARYAMAIQVVVEMIALLLFVWCVLELCGPVVAWLTGLLYLFAYPFLWPIASQPLRDVFALASFSFAVAAAVLVMRKRGWPIFALASILIAFAALFLWCRPTGYYFFFGTAVVALFARQVDLKRRLALAAALFLIPLLVFGLPYKRFNVKYYGTASTSFQGVWLWEGMGIIKDNPYGFVENDLAIIPFVQSLGLPDTEISPRVNEMLLRYSLNVIKKDPLYYAKTVAKRCGFILLSPLQLELPFVRFTSPPAADAPSLLAYLGQYPKESALKFALWVLPGAFFYLGLFAAGWLWWRQRNLRLELLLLQLPLVYTLAYQIPLHFESRYLAVGAWVLVLPIACLLTTVGRRSRGESAIDHPGAK